MRRLSPLVAMVTVATSFVTLTGEASATVTGVQGSAYGYHASIGLFGSAPMERGQADCSGALPFNPLPAGRTCAAPAVTLPPGGSAVPITASAATGDARFGPGVFFTSGQQDVSTQGTTGPGGSVTSTAHITDVPQSTVGEILYAGDILATCTASQTSVNGQTGASGSTTITGPGNPLETNSGPPFPDPPNPAPSHATLEVSNGDPDVDGDETFFVVPTKPEPNTTVHGQLESVGDSFRVVFNEQIANPDGSLTVNAVHEYALGPTAVGEAIIGHVVCGVTAVSDANPPINRANCKKDGWQHRTTAQGTPFKNQGQCVSYLTRRAKK